MARMDSIIYLFSPWTTIGLEMVLHRSPDRYSSRRGWISTSSWQLKDDCSNVHQVRIILKTDKYHRLPLEASLRPDPLGCHLRRRLSLRVHRRNPNTTNCLRVAVRWQCFIRLERLSTSRRDHTQLFGLQSICSFLSWA
jgi:hypothetical protein